MTDYHPLAIRLWSVMIIHKDGRHELPPAVVKAALILLRRIDDAAELQFVHQSTYSLWAETRRLGQKEASEAFFEIVEEARRLAEERGDTWVRAAPKRPAAPDILPRGSGDTPTAPTPVLPRGRMVGALTPGPRRA